MGKVQEKTRTYKKEWESQSWAKGWLTRADQSCFNEAYCTLCHKVLRAHKADLLKHTTSRLHRQHVDSINREKQTPVTSHFQPTIGQQEKLRDLRIAVYAASHTSIRNIDHLCDILVDLGKGSSFENFEMHRTKCGNVIKHVIAPCMLSDLIDDVGDKSFSLIVDESTDVSTFKYLCLCIKYFSEAENRLITDYLGIIAVESATADALYEAVIEFTKNINLKLSNLLGIGTDGGANLWGKNQSLYALLKKDIPNLQLVRCICHLLENASSNAAEEFPASIDFLCREIFNWFHLSPLRRLKYRETWDTINVESVDINGNQRVYHQFVKLSGTRWLSRYNVVRVLLEHWIELKIYFRLALANEKCYTARLIDQMLTDDANFLYLKFLKPILYEVNHLNLIFQLDNVDLGLAHEDLSGLVLLLARKILKPPFVSGGVNTVLKADNNDLAYLEIDNVDFGIEFYQALNNCNVEIEKRIEVETRAFRFLKKLLSELLKRLPNNFKLYQGLKSLSPDVCLSHIRPPFKELPLLKEIVNESQLGIIETQCNKLLTIDWQNSIDKSMLKRSHTFWPVVYSFEDAVENYVFRDLALYALRLLPLPSSNAVVKRVFSIMNAVKTRCRNRMAIGMFDALLRIRIRFYSKGSCCKGFQPTKAMSEK